MADIPGFIEAIEDARRRGIVLPEVFYGDTLGRIRAGASTVSGLASLDQVQAIMDSLHEALEQGQRFGTWKKKLLASGRDFGLAPHHLETIFRTNMQTWYASGRAEQIQRNKDVFPYLKYSAILDARVRPSHARLDGLILPVDHPFWATHTPPWGFSCRCSVIPMTERQAKAAIGKARETGRVIDEVPGDVASPAPGWAYNRLDPAAPLEGLERALLRKAGQCIPRQFAVRKRGTPVLWCDGPGADALDMAMTALHYDDSMPPPRRLPESLEVMPGLNPAEYLAAFMREFDAGPKETVLWPSLAQQTLAISRAMFEKQSGASKLTKRGRQVFVRYLARGIKEPDEVWYVRKGSTEKLYYLTRFSGRQVIGVQSVFRWNGKLWDPVTGYQHDNIRHSRDTRKSLQSSGVLLYRRN